MKKLSHLAATAPDGSRPFAHYSRADWALYDMPPWAQARRVAGDNLAFRALTLRTNDRRVLQRIIRVQHGLEPQRPRKMWLLGRI